MDKIQQYYKITNVKPEYHVLYIPYHKPSKKRIVLNGNELELHYVDEFSVYVEKNNELKVGAGPLQISEKKNLFVSFD